MLLEILFINVSVCFSGLLCFFWYIMINNFSLCDVTHRYSCFFCLLLLSLLSYISSYEFIIIQKWLRRFDIGISFLTIFFRECRKTCRDAENVRFCIGEGLQLISVPVLYLQWNYRPPGGKHRWKSRRIQNVWWDFSSWGGSSSIWALI